MGCRKGIVGDLVRRDPRRHLDAGAVGAARRLSRAGVVEARRARLVPWCVCVDSGGHRTTEVYEFCRARLARNIFAIKGYAGAGKPIVGKATTSNQLRVPLYPVGADTGKEAVYSRLALAEPGPGYCHFPIDRARGYDDEFFKALVSEKRVTKIRAGRRTTEWKQVRARNEALDVRVYATAAMELLTPDFGALAAADAAARGAAPTQTGGPAPRRRVHSRGVDS
jgi:phage terminase large subunit GpA-like protein